MTIMQMFPNNSAVQAIREGGYGSADFDIAVAPLQYPIWNNAEKRTSSKSVIYRTDTGEELGIHGHGYKPIAPKHMINVGDALLERSDLCLNKLERIIRTSHNGARTFVQYRLPEHTYKTSDGDEASLSLLAISSFDGTWPFMISAAAIQSACTNLQVFVGGEVSVFKAKHTQSLDIEQGGRIITKSLDLFQNQRGLWQQWNDTECSNLQAFKSFAEAIKCKSALDLLYKGYTSPVDALMDIPRRNNNLDYLWYKYSSVYSKRLGNNYWAVYNALTDWSTHFEAPRKSSIDNIASIQNDRQQLVREAIKHNHNMKAA
tara:strand:+ start:1109 stop:2059 length:951 start_codon:yes stop_codon:yes gene_type:complete